MGRSGYDFDSRWDDELASLRQKRIMDQFAVKDELFSFELKRLAGFGEEGEKNFEGTVTDLQMGGYLLIRDFRQHLNKKGQPYGWPISVYTTPENLWGYEHISSAYSTEPMLSKELVYDQVHRNFPAATEATLQAVLGWDR
ncbi:AlkZ-related protein [Intestinimonas massiliensis (ex Afouda et al. 2020)]|uniref:AlkZ-related protein n=1 Tax=Intestinimonas massiliensis (ex Afouda et al. 2020) TaxID=1673721 RepID=UPI003F68A339